MSLKFWISVCLICSSTALVHAATVSDEEALESLRQQIVTMIGESRCENIVHCRLLPLGSRPCGGPAEYLAYSSITSRRDVLEAKAYEYGFLQEEINRTQGLTGTCQMLSEPRVACVNGRCTLNSDRR